MNYLQKTMISYYKWRKGVLMLMLLEAVLILGVLGLLIVTFIVSLTSTKGSLALATLRNHLNLLQIRFNKSSIMNAEEERSDIEKLINDVKAACPKHIISHDVNLKAKLHLVYMQISSIADNRSDVTKTSWIKLRAVAYDFGESYVPGFAK